MPSYKLTYFNIRGRGEVIRLILHYAGEEFEDNRIQKVDWPALKPDMPHGQMPVLEIDGKAYTQSHALARHLAKIYGLMGANDNENFYIDMMVDTAEDILRAMEKAYFEEDETKKVAVFQYAQKKVATGAKYLDSLLEEAGAAGFCVESGLTWADLKIYDVLCMAQSHGFHPELFNKCPSLAANKKAVDDHPRIAEYLAKRPATNI